MLLTIGQRNFFFPEMYCQSKSREVNHSHLFDYQKGSEIEGGEYGAHIEAEEGMHKPVKCNYKELSMDVDGCEEVGRIPPSFMVSSVDCQLTIAKGVEEGLGWRGGGVALEGRKRRGDR